MKARIQPTKLDVERVNEQVWSTICEAQTSSNAIMLIAVKRKFGLGPKRIRELCEYFEEVRKEFDQYDADGVFQDKINEELEDVGVDTSGVWDVPQTFEETKRECERRKRPIVSIGEARGIRQMFDGFKWLKEHMKHE